MQSITANYRSQEEPTVVENLKETTTQASIPRSFRKDHFDARAATDNTTTTLSDRSWGIVDTALQEKILKARSKKLGRDHPTTIESINSLALAYWNEARWQEVELLYSELVETKSRVLGVEHADTLSAMANLAATYCNQARWDEAVELEVLVKNHRSVALGDEHPSTLIAMANLASSYRKQGRLSDSQELWARVRYMSAKKYK
jgi:hypothetical protein